MKQWINKERARRKRNRDNYRTKNAEKIREASKRYREKYKERIRAREKQYRREHREQRRLYNRQYPETHREEQREQRRLYCRQYYEAHRESLAKRRKESRENNREAAREFMKKYRANTFGMSLRQRLDSEKKKTEEKLKGLGPEKLTVTLTDYLKSPPPSMNQRTHVARYFESFCQTLDVEGGDVSFVDTLNQQNMNQVTMRNLDSYGTWMPTNGSMS